MKNFILSVAIFLLPGAMIAQVEGIDTSRTTILGDSVVAEKDTALWVFDSVIYIINSVPVTHYQAKWVQYRQGATMIIEVSPILRRTHIKQWMVSRRQGYIDERANLKDRYDEIGIWVSELLAFWQLL